MPSRHALFLACVQHRIKAVREAKGLTQAEVANRVDMRPEDFQRFESLRGKKRFNPTLATLLLITEALEIELAELLAPPTDAELKAARQQQDVT
ncbi:MAG: helix-turn-helix transcriptional regulator [Deinococcota bacterium]